MSQATADLPQLTIGIDLSDDMSTYVGLDATGAKTLEGKFPTVREGVLEAFSELEPSRMIVEACLHGSWVARALLAMGHEVYVANPRKVQLISKSSRKTDRNDALTLARLGRADPELLHPVWLRPESAQSIRATLRTRRQLVRMRARLITMARSECKVHGTRLEPCASSYFARKMRPMIPSILRDALAPALSTIEHLDEEVGRLDKRVEAMCKAIPVTGALRQVRGVGPLVALAFVTSIVDPRRFKDSRTVGAYLGLTPRSYQSGSSDPHLRISKEGDRDLRVLLVTAATHMMRQSSPDTDLKRFGRRIACRGNPRDRARARIAVARKLAVLLHRLWTTGEVYEPLRMGSAA